MVEKEALAGGHEINGVWYKNLTIACEKLGFDFVQIYARMSRDKNLSAEDAMYNFTKKSAEGIEVDFNGKRYKSISEVARTTGASQKLITNYMKDYGLPIEIAVYLAMTDEQFTNFIYHDKKLYLSKKHLCESHGFTVNHVNSVKKYNGFEDWYDAFVYYLQAPKKGGKRK